MYGRTSKRNSYNQSFVLQIRIWTFSVFYNPPSPVSEIRISRYMICFEHVHWKCTFAILKTYKPQLRRTLAFLIVKRNKSMKPGQRRRIYIIIKTGLFVRWLTSKTFLYKSCYSRKAVYFSVHHIHSIIVVRTKKSMFGLPDLTDVFNTQIYWNLLIRGNICKKTKEN